MKASRTLAIAVLSVFGMAAIAVAASLQGEPAAGAALRDTGGYTAVPLETDMAECRAECSRKFQRCSDGGTRNIETCLAEQKKCIEACR